MRVRVDHLTTYRYQPPAKAVLQVLRLSPRSHEGQNVVRWRVSAEADVEVQLRRGEDALGNVTQTAFLQGPVSGLALRVEGEVETWDTRAVVRGAAERFPVEAYLRETGLTAPSPELAAFAEEVAAGDEAEVLARLHRLMLAIRGEIAFDTHETQTTTTAAEAFALKRGVCQDLSHIFIAAARRLGIPARYVSGHLAREGEAIEQDAAHAWAEAYAPDLGWIGFDATNGICPTPAYVRVAIGLDYLGAAPVRGARTGGGAETMDVRLRVSHAALQSQS
ncbi:MAG TPA: transglutaminase family protein [Caulobacteraceae bacterium]